MPTLAHKRDLICSNVMLNIQLNVTFRSKLQLEHWGVHSCAKNSVTKLKKQLKRKKKIPPYLVLGRTYKIVEGLPVRPRDLPSNCGFPNSNSTQLIWFTTAAVKQVAFSFIFFFGRLWTAAKKLKVFADSRTQPGLFHPLLEGYLCNPEGIKLTFVYTVDKSYTVYKPTAQTFLSLARETSNVLVVASI